MGRGAKKGSNRFEGFQDEIQGFRVDRLQLNVVPILKTMSSHAKINSINKFTKLCAQLFNTDLPITDKPISYRTIKQNEIYWQVVGDVYYRYFQKEDSLEGFKNDSLLKLEIKELNDLLSEKENEIRVLKLMLGKKKSHETPVIIDKSAIDTSIDLDKLCRVISNLIDAFDGVIEVNVDKGAINNLANDFEPEYGILPLDIVKPYINWLKNKEEKLGGLKNE